MTAAPDLSGRVALVTGGSKALGAATAERLAGHGAAVGVGGRDEDAIGRVVDRIRTAGGRALGVPADVTDAGAVDECYHRLDEAYGPVDLVAAFAGGNGFPRPTEQVGAAEWRGVLESDLTSTFLTVRAALPTMMERSRGSIVTMASSSGRQPSPAAAAYAAAKAGVVMLTKHLAVEMASHGIRVNCLAPSAVRNERMTGAMTAEQLAGLGASFPLGRIGEPADVAAAALFLLSDQSSWITGVTLDLSGGRVVV